MRRLGRPLAGRAVESGAGAGLEQTAAPSVSPPAPPSVSPPAAPSSPASSSGGAPAPGREPDPALVAERERLTERFTVMQTELGGLFYEMAIRDHVRMEILMGKAAALQRIDSELAQVEHLLDGGDAGIGGHCPACGAVHAHGAAFCSQCAASLTP